MHKFTPEQIIDEFYGPPEKEAQKKLEDFKKKQILKPEKPKGLFSVVSAETQEGKEIIFDIKKIKEESREMFDNFNLSELAEAIEGTEINLTAEQTDTIIQKAKEGFNKFYLMPPIEIQEQYLDKIKKETEKEMAGLTGNQQYDAKEGTYLSDAVKEKFPANIKNFNRPSSKPYLLFIKDTVEVDDETRGKAADQMREILKQKQETGFTLPEYLIFQRDYTKRNQTQNIPHPETKCSTWLLDSEIASSHVMKAVWGSDSRQVEVYSSSSGVQHSARGCRSSVVLLIH